MTYADLSDIRMALSRALPHGERSRVVILTVKQMETLFAVLKLARAVLDGEEAWDGEAHLNA